MTSHRRALALGLPLLLTLAAVSPLTAQQGEPMRLSLERALEIAEEGSPALGAMRERVREMEEKASTSFTNYLPRIRTQANWLASNNSQGILIPQGSLGSYPELGGGFPPRDTNIPQGGTDLFFSLTTLAQPLTHFFQIREGRGVALADETAARAELLATRQEVRLGVLRAYAGLLVAERGIEVAMARVAAAREQSTVREAALASGNVLEVASREARVRWLQARQALLEREDERDDLAWALADALGLPAGTALALEAPAPLPLDRAPAELRLVRDLPGGEGPAGRAAPTDSPEVMGARALVTKATHALGAARAAWIPEVGIVGAHIYQSSVPFFPKNTLGVGIQGKWTILDFGARGNLVEERRALLRQAEHNLRLVEGRVRGELEASARRVERARAMVELAREAAALRVEGARLQALQVGVGYALAVDRMNAEADTLEAELDLLRAELGYRIALAELEKAAGSLGR